MAKYTITAPVPKSCYGYGLNFVEGVATTENKRIADYLKDKGYKVKKEKDETAPPQNPPAGNDNGGKAGSTEEE